MVAISFWWLPLKKKIMETVETEPIKTETKVEEESTAGRAWVKSGSEILALRLRQVPTLVDPFVPKYGTMSLAGSSDLGKSYLLLQLSDAVINGATSFLGFTLNVTHKSVIYLSTEDDEYSLSPRLMNMAKNKTDLSGYENLRVIFESNDLVRRLDTLLTEKPTDLVIIDTFSDIFDGDMNQANKVRSFIQKFKELTVKHKTLIIFNHHCGKKNDYRPPHKDNLLGSQGFESSMRTVIELRKDFSNPSHRHLCIVKGNYLSESFKNSSFALEFNFEDGFSNTGERLNFDRLVKSDERGAPAARNAIKEKVVILKAEGLSYGKIAAKLKAEGTPISKSTVGNICKENRPAVQFPMESESDGQAA